MTPGAHPLIRAAWLASAIVVVAGLALALREGRPGAILLIAGVLLFAAGYVAYLARHLAFEVRVRRAEQAIDALELERARLILAPLLERYQHLALVQRAAGRALYALGDPLSAAALLERAARSFGEDAVLAATLVASYAALNRGADARRASSIAPASVDVRLALAWSELVALGGDRAAGAAMVRELRDRADVRDRPSRRAMASMLGAIAAAHAGDVAAADAALAEAAAACEGLPPYERAFLGYLDGVALRELGRTSEAIAAFERAMATAPTIGEALARRERANTVARLSAS